MSAAELDSIMGRVPQPRPELTYEPVDDGPIFLSHSTPSRAPSAYQLNGGKPLTVIGLEELESASPEPPPMLGPIPRVGLTVIAGPPKIGKSLFASQMAISATWATGVTEDGANPLFLGRDLRDVDLLDEAGTSTALLVMEEGSLAGIGYRLRMQQAGLGVTGARVSVAHRQRIRLDEKESRVRLRAYVEEWQPNLIVLDPLNRLHGADENKPSSMTPVMDAMAGIAYDFKCAVLAIHHLGKPSAERRGDIWDRFRGASSIRSGTDANLAMDGAGAKVELAGEYRDAEPLRTFLELDRDALVFQPAEPPTLPGKIDRDELDVYLRPKAQVTVREIAAHFKASKNTAQTALDSLGLDTYDGPRGTRFYVTSTAQ